MHYPDFSHCVYGQTLPEPHILNIGWLSGEQPYTRGESPEWLATRLKELIRSPVNLYRGRHLCEFCPAPPTVLSPGGLKMINPPPETMGNGEIRIQASDGTIYVAPVLIYHYVTEHGYLLPAKFLAAIIE